jgi:hypothetical protein
MAKINVEFDTKSKAMQVTMDGIVMENVDGIYVWKYYEDNKFSFEVTTCETSAEKDFRKCTRIVAADGSLVEKPKVEFEEVKTEDVSKMLGL